MRNNLPLLDKYEKILKEDKKSVVFAPLAEIYRKAGEFKKAIKICDKGLEHNPNYLSGVIVLANCYYELENFQKAREVLSQYICSNPENISLQKLWGKVNLALGKTEEALKCFKKLLFLFPADLELSELVENLEVDKSPFKEIILDDEDNPIDFKNWEQKPLVNYDMKKNESTSISFAKLFNEIGDSEKVGKILDNLESENNYTEKTLDKKEVNEIEINQPVINNLMDYFDLKAGQISELIEDSEEVVERVLSNSEDHLGRISKKLKVENKEIEPSNKLEDPNGRRDSAQLNQLKIDMPSLEIINEIKSRCNEFLNLLQERRTLVTSN